MFSAATKTLLTPRAAAATPFVYDTFTDTDGTLLTAHTGETGATWALATGSASGITITSNRMYNTVVGAYYYASGTPPSADYEVEAVVRVVTNLTGSTTVMAVGGRMSTSARTAYLACADVTAAGALRIRIQSRINNTIGTLNVVNSVTTPTAGTDHTLKLKMLGSAISAWWDGVQVSSGTSTEITAAGKAGVYGNAVSTTSTGHHFDSITAT
jgi:hypothetical protein